MAVSARLEQNHDRSAAESCRGADRPARDGLPSAVDTAAELAAARREVDQLHEALASNRTTGAATGLLAARYGCTTAQAWSLLVRISQQSNLKVALVAATLQQVFDGAPVTGQRARVLQAVDAHLPAGGWTAHHGRGGR